MFRAHRTHPTALITIDSAGRITDCDTRSAGPLAWPEAQVLHTSIADLIGPGNARSDFMAWLSAASTTATAKSADDRTCTALVAGDGRVVDAVVHLEPSRLYADTRFLFVYVPESDEPGFAPDPARLESPVLH